MPGELLIRLTIWGSMCAYAVFLFMQLWPNRFRWTVRRVIWTISWLLFLGHFVSAFHYYHKWSHVHAVADTARQTKELIGWSFGEGIYFSYLFLALWAFDVAWWWLAADSYQTRATLVEWMIHGFLLFIAINGTAIFESGATRIATVICCAGLLIGMATRIRKS